MNNNVNFICQNPMNGFVEVEGFVREENNHLFNVYRHSKNGDKIVGSAPTQKSAIDLIYEKYGWCNPILC